MPLYFFHTKVQRSKKITKLKSRGPALIIIDCFKMARVQLFLALEKPLR